MAIDAGFLERRHLFLAGESVMPREIDDEDLSDAADRSDYLAILDRALTEREREMIGLRFKRGLTYKEIGSMFGLSPSRVAQIISKAIYNAAGAERREAERCYLKRMANGLGKWRG